MPRFLLSVAAVLLGAAAAAQSPSGDPTLPPKGLTVVTLDVGQGDATIIVSPTGLAMVVDAGPEGAGRSVVIPKLRALGVKSVLFAVASHYHTDHIGGMDEVIDNFTVASVWDRGLSNAPTTSSYRNYARSAGNKRNTVRVGSTFVLGGGAKATVLAANGKVGSTTYPIVGKPQYENSASVVLKLEYGDFSMWLGGDLTGGGLKTYDVESPAAAACGDVDVYSCNHHGSNTSSNLTLVGRLNPEVCLASAGAGNSFGHPTTSVTNRLNSKSASRLFLCTTRGARSLQGFESDGSITITTDGYRYRMTGNSNRPLDLYTDEVAATRVPLGTLRISEVQRSPRTSEGEYLEVYCHGPGPVNLRGLQISSNSGSVTIRAPYRMLPGDYLLFLMQGDNTRNGGLPFGHCLPYRAVSFGNSADTITLRLNGQQQDRLVYTSLSGGYGVAAERWKLEEATSPANFRAATWSYGSSGNRGTPGTRNSVDATTYKPVAAMEILPNGAFGGRALNLIATAPAHRLKRHVMVMSLGNSPGMTILGTHIPLNPDVLFDASLLLPGVMGTIPAGGRRGLRLKVPLVNGLQGLRAHYAHVILDPSGPVPFPAASNAASFIFP